PVPRRRADRQRRALRRLELLVDGGRARLRARRRGRREGGDVSDTPPSFPPGAPPPRVSIVIPVYNEQAILHAAVIDLRERLEGVPWSYEVILAENGSRDDTLVI